MEKMNDLSDLLKHEIQDLYSAEEQIIAALPAMIGKAKNPELKKALQNHLKVTEQQRSRLEQVQNIMGGKQEGESKGLLSRLFKNKQVCRGMEGLIEEGTKVMKEDMDPDVLDAAIIACAQKIEHYEICGYGTARTYARELNLEPVAKLLEQTLNEEYMADDLLTQLAVTRVNVEAEKKSAARPQAAQPAQSKSAGNRGAGGERTRKEEPAMEMAVAGRGTAAAKKTTTPGKPERAPAPKGSGARSSVTAGRGAASKTTAAGGRTAAKSATRSNGRNAATGARGGTTARNGRTR